MPPSQPSPSGGRSKPGPGPNEVMAQIAPRPSAATARAGLPHPSGRAEERRARGGPWHCKMPWLQALACCGCLNGVNAVNNVSSAAPLLDRAPEVARSEAQGHGKWGRPFFGYFLSAKRKKVTALPGALPRPPTSNQQQKVFNKRREQVNRRLPPPQPSPSGGGRNTLTPGSETQVKFAVLGVGPATLKGSGR